MFEINKKLVIVAHASTGSGHTVAAKAIFEAINNTDENIEVMLVDILDYSKVNSSGEKFVSATSGVLAPIYDFTWRKNFTGRILWGGGNLWPSFLFKKFEDFLIEKMPDLVVCTHQVCANSAAKARIKSSKKFRIVSVPTDYETEGLWPHMQSDLFCVANVQMAQTLISRRVKSENIVISGLPVENKFSTSYLKKEAKEKFKLPKSKKCILVICGAKESGPYKNIRKLLNSSIKSFANIKDAQFIFCVGKDISYKRRLDKKIQKYAAINISTITYTENLAQLMAACDIALIKPGGLVITECACAKLPVILVGKTYAQENINRRNLEFSNACVHAITSKGLISAIDLLMHDKKTYKILKTNIAKVANENSANIICEAIINMLNSNVDIISNRVPSIYIGKMPAHTR